MYLLILNTVFCEGGFGVQRFRVQRFRGSGFRGFCGDKKRISNVEYRIMNVEGMYSARREFLCRTVYLIIKTEQSETTLRYSAVRYSTVRFCLC